MVTVCQSTYSSHLSIDLSIPLTFLLYHLSSHRCTRQIIFLTDLITTNLIIDQSNQEIFEESCVLRRRFEKTKTNETLITEAGKSK